MPLGAERPSTPAITAGAPVHSMIDVGRKLADLVERPA